jgi:hypothetical protein
MRIFTSQKSARDDKASDVERIPWRLLLLRTNERASEVTTLIAFGEAFEEMTCAEHVATIQEEWEEIPQ